MLIVVTRKTRPHDSCSLLMVQVTPSQHYTVHSHAGHVYASMGPPDCKLGVLEQKGFFERVPINMTGNCLFESLDSLSEGRFTTESLREETCNQLQYLLDLRDTDVLGSLQYTLRHDMHPVTVRLKNLTLASLKECHEYVCTMRLDGTHGLMLEIGVAASVLRHPIELIGHAADSVHLEVLDSWLVSPGGHCSHHSITDEKKYQELSDKHSDMICILYQQYLSQALHETHDLILSAVCSHTPHAATQTHDPASPTATSTALTSGMDSRQHQIKRGGAVSDPPMPQQADLCEGVATGQVSETMENILVHTAQTNDADNSNSLVFLTSIDSNRTTHQSALTDRWGNQISKDFVDTKLDWIGDRDILGRTHGGIIVMTVNSRGQTDPRLNQDKIEDKCRLSHLTSLVTSALIDIVVVPEAAAKLNEKLAFHATRLV